MQTADLIRLYPELYHMAADGSWPSIQRHGLLSTLALADAWEIGEGAARASLLEQRRPESVVIEHLELGVATVRDHGPINSASLEAALVDMTPEEWFGVLNERVFFFLQRHRLESLLGAYSKEPQIVLTLDTASVVAAYVDKIELCGFNSGFAQPHNKKPRGRDSFLPIAAYPHPARDVANPKGRDIAELTVLGRIEVAPHVLRIERIVDGQTWLLH